MFPHLSTAPHQPRKKRELTRAVELLKIKYGGEREPHRLLSAPLASLANVFTSLTADEFTVNGFKMSTILTPCFKVFEVLEVLALFSDPRSLPPGRWAWGVPVLYRCDGTFWGDLGWKVD